MASALLVRAAVAALVVLGLAVSGHAQLQQGYYKGRCGPYDVEAIVQGIAKARFTSNPAIVAFLLRMLFHECGVKGCDGGLLIDGVGTEKTASPNLSVKGYDVILAIKTELEKKCAGVVSCSDIQVLATRDAVALAGGPAYEYPVRTGRKDCKNSSASVVVLPSPESTVEQSIAFYNKLGLSTSDMVVLLGAHTVGVTHCNVIKNSRLYKYGGKAGATDPNMDPYYAMVYKNWVCPNTASSDNTEVYLDDAGSKYKVDNSYYKMLQKKRGVLTIDQNLYNDPSTKNIVNTLANDANRFASLFPKALMKLGELGVLTGTKGEIRRVCNKFN